MVSVRVRQALATLSLTYHGIAPSYGEELRDDVPSATAYEILDALVAAQDTLRAVASLPGVEIVIGPIARHDVSSGDPVWRTGVEVTLCHAWLSAGYGWVVLAEPLAEADDDEDEDEDDR